MEEQLQQGTGENTCARLFLCMKQLCFDKKTPIVFRVHETRLSIVRNITSYTSPFICSLLTAFSFKFVPDIYHTGL